MCIIFVKQSNSNVACVKDTHCPKQKMSATESRLEIKSHMLSPWRQLDFSPTVALHQSHFELQRCWLLSSKNTIVHLSINSVVVSTFLRA